MSDLDALIDAARSVQDRVVDLRRRIHAEPELGLNLPETRAKVEDELADLGLDVALHQHTSGIVATLRGARPGRRVMLRGDMDALPMPENTDLPFQSVREGRMHACGHDAHTAMLAGAARVLVERRDALSGEIVFLFQPGEEGFAGARRMLEEGLPEVDAVFAIHIAPQFPSGMIYSKPGPILASADAFRIQVQGEGGHASMPHDCRDPVPAACEMVLALQSFVTRRIPATDPVVLTVSQINAGTASNVIPEAVSLAGTLRALSERSREIARQGLRDVVEGIARTHGLEVEFQLRPGYPVTRNEPGFEGFVRDVAAELLGDAGVAVMPDPLMGAEDFSYLLQRFPGAFVFLGVRPPGEKRAAPCHSNRMLLDEDALVFGTALHAAVATRFLESGVP
jgi:hippurate hydrolase